MRVKSKALALFLLSSVSAAQAADTEVLVGTYILNQFIPCSGNGSFGITGVPWMMQLIQAQTYAVEQRLQTATLPVFVRVEAKNLGKSTEPFWDEFPHVYYVVRLLKITQNVPSNCLTLKEIPNVRGPEQDIGH